MRQSLAQLYAFIRGGNPVMILILVASVICVALIIERFFALRRKKVLPYSFTEEIDELVSKKKTTDALALCKVSNLPIARVISSGLTIMDEGKDEMREVMERSARQEISFLEKNLDYLGTLAAVGPLLGLFGTVTGMIQTFGVIRILGVGDPLKLSGGIAEALLSTAGGLVVGIPALVFQRYYLSKVDGFVLEMEEIGSRVLKLAGVK